MAFLFACVSGMLVGRKYPVGAKELRIGRDQANDIVIPDPSVSRFHACLTLHSQQPVIIDLGSTHGTWVNRRRITVPTAISPSDQINIGVTDFAIEGLGEPPIQTPVPAAAPAPPTPAVPPPNVSTAPTTQLQWPFVAEGQDARLEVYPDRVRIVRYPGFSNLVLHGIRGDKEIFLRSISGIQFKPLTTWTVGYIQFTFGGGLEAKKGIREAVQDENTVSFRKGQEVAFDYAKQLIDSLVAETHRPTTHFSAADELLKLSTLFTQGVITQDEFQRAKARLGF